jgi:hypothetical protein
LYEIITNGTNQIKEMGLLLRNIRIRMLSLKSYLPSTRIGEKVEEKEKAEG